MKFEESVDAEAIGKSTVGNRTSKAETTRALAIIVPTTLVGQAAASAMLVPKLIADAGDNASLRFLDDHHFLMTNENHRDVSRI